MKNYISRTITLVGVCVAASFFCGNARATLTAIAPFAGSLSETWESFANYTVGPDPVNYLPSGTAIMGGGATISTPALSSPVMVLYEPSVAEFSLGDNGEAQTAEGTKGSKGMGLKNYGQTATISFLNPIFEFGAYWGASGPSPSFGHSGTVTLSFSYGSSVESVDFVYYPPINPADEGQLVWQGWRSDIGITSISYMGDFVAIDGLQANLAPVPEPSTWLAGALLALPFGVQGVRWLRTRQ